MTDPFTQSRPASPASAAPSPRALLWSRLEALHAQLGLDPPTATLTLEELAAEVERLAAEAGTS